MLPTLVFLSLLTTASSQAAIVKLGIGKFSPVNPPAVSDDGYHFALADGRRLVKDGKILVSDTSGANMMTEERYINFTLSRDGSVLAHPMAVKDEAGNVLGQSMGINGRRVGGVFKAVSYAMLSPNGSNIAFAVESEKGHGVVSNAGSGPMLPKAPIYTSVGDHGVLYQVDWNNQRWLYRDHNPVAALTTYAWYADPSLSHILGITLADDRDVVDLDKRAIGSWPKIGMVHFSGDGRHTVFFAKSKNKDGDYDEVVVDGTPYPAAGVTVDANFHPGTGEAWWYVIDNSRADPMINIFKNGVLVGRWAGGHAPSSKGWVAFSPSGRRWGVVLFLKEAMTLIVDGEVVSTDAPVAAPGSKLVFDAENELHYLARTKAGAYAIVCVGLGETSAKNGRCAQNHRAIYGRPAGDDAE